MSSAHRAPPSALRRLNPGFASILADGIPAYARRARLGSASNDDNDDDITPMQDPSEKTTQAASSASSGELKFRGATVAPTTSYLPPAVEARVQRGRIERWNIPFVWKNDVPRGLIAAMASLLHYALM